MAHEGTPIPDELISRWGLRCVAYVPLSAIAGYAVSTLTHLSSYARFGDELVLHDVLAAAIAGVAGGVAAGVSVLDGENGIVSAGVVIELPRSVRRGIIAGSLAGVFAGIGYAGLRVDVEALLRAAPFAWAIGGLGGWIVAALVGSPVDSERLDDTGLNRLAQSRLRRRTSAWPQISLALSVGGVVGLVAAFPFLVSLRRGENDPAAVLIVIAMAVLAAFAGSRIRAAAKAKRDAEAEHEYFKAELQGRAATGAEPGGVSLAAKEGSGGELSAPAQEGAVSLPRDRKAD